MVGRALASPNYEVSEACSTAKFQYNRTHKEKQHVCNCHHKALLGQDSA